MIRKKNPSLVFSNKKGSALIIGLIALVLIGFIFLLTTIGTQHFLLGEVNEMVQEDDFFSDTAKAKSSELETKNNTAWDNAFAFLVGGVLVGLFIAGFTLENNPLILGVVIIVMFFGVYAGMHIVNLYEEVAADTTDTLDFETHFPKAHFVMTNLVLVIGVGISLLALGVFVSNRVGVGL